MRSSRRGKRVHARQTRGKPDFSNDRLNRIKLALLARAEALLGEYARVTAALRALDGR